MIADLKPYEEYRECQIEWMGALPITWAVDRAKWILKKVDRPVRPDDEVVTCFRDGQVTLRKNRRTTGFTEATAEVGYQGIRRGDLVIHQMDAFAGAVGISDSDGKATPVYSVCVPTDNAVPAYYAALVREMARKGWIEALAKGIRERSTDFRFDTFKNLHVPIPPRSEQEAIVRFLVLSNRRIDRFVRSKRKLIALLEEQKRAIISQAVTRGLDPDAPLKPSGIPWLGEVPSHWEVTRTKYLFREVDHRSATGSEEQLSVSHLTGVTPRSQKNVTMFKAQSYVGHKVCEPGDLVINTMWAWMAALGVAFEVGIVSPAYGVYRPLKGSFLNPEFADYMFRAEPYRRNYLAHSTGIRASRLRLYPDKFLALSVALPGLDEQVAIVHELARRTSKARIAIEQATREVKLIEEYRAQLTSDVVTGQLDVREAEVPDTQDGGTALDELLGERMPEFEEELEFTEAEV